MTIQKYSDAVKPPKGIYQTYKQQLNAGIIKTYQQAVQAGNTTPPSPTDEDDEL
jgi:hypothetical protein